MSFPGTIVSVNPYKNSYFYRVKLDNGKTIGSFRGQSLDQFQVRDKVNAYCYQDDLSWSLSADIFNGVDTFNPFE